MQQTAGSGQKQAYNPVGSGQPRAESRQAEQQAAQPPRKHAAVDACDGFGAVRLCIRLLSIRPPVRAGPEAGVLPRPASRAQSARTASQTATAPTVPASRLNIRVAVLMPVSSENQFGVGDDLFA